MSSPTAKPPRGTIIDISQTISTSIAVWPGDTRFSAEWVMRKDSGCSCNVSTIRMSLHTGTHADAPFHYLDEGDDAASVDLRRYCGPCRVVEARHPASVSLDDVQNLPSGIERVLFKTPGSVHEDTWRDDFTFLSRDAAAWLVNRGILLVGIDTPSMDPMTSKTLDAHHTLSRGRTAILENLKLDHVPSGDYELMAFPLKIRGADSAPVRAVLRVI